MEVIDSDITALRQRFLKMDRPLLPIDEYAKREKITPSEVKELAKIGVVQIRKFKDNTFVVDIPFGLYPDDEVQPIDTIQVDQKTLYTTKHTKIKPAQAPIENIVMKTVQLFKSFNVSNSLRNTFNKFIKDLQKNMEKISTKLNTCITRSGSISVSAQKTITKFHKITAKLNQDRRPKNSSQPLKPKSCTAIKKPIESNNEKKDKNRQIPKLTNERPRESSQLNNKEKPALTTINKIAPQPQQKSENIQQHNSSRYDLSLELTELKEKLEAIQKQNAQAIENLDTQLDSISKRLKKTPECH